MFFLVLLIMNTFAEDVTSKMAEQVIQLRQEVETLNDSYETDKEIAYNKIRAIGAKKAELESNIQTDELRNKQINNKMTEIKKSLLESSLDSQELIPLINNYITKLNDQIKVSIPFKKTERLKDLEQLKNKLDKKELSPIAITSKLWQIIEDEKRISKENTLEKQVINIDNKEQLAQVAKLGMMNLFFVTEDNQYGYAVQKGSEWVFQVTHQSEDKKQIKNLVQSMKKQIRTGYFEVPQVAKRKTGEKI